MILDAHAIHAALGAEGWTDILQQLGIESKFLRDKHGPCPACGGKDRFRFDNKGKGRFICSKCGAGDGFKLLMTVLGKTFSDVRQMVIEAGKLEGSQFRKQLRAQITQPGAVQVAKPTQRVIKLLRESCPLENCDAARIYLDSRALWPIPKGATLRAHPSVEYWQEHQRVGHYPALIAAVRDCAGELVTAHVTYLTEGGQKLEGYEPRKILSGMAGREGCVAPIMDLDGDVLGIAEGIETAYSAAVLEGIPVWAALNAGMMAKFLPPQSISKLLIFADLDVAGMQAAAQLMERLQERVRLEIRTPRAGDFNDALKGGRETRRDSQGIAP